MPFKSKAQMKKFFAMEKRGEMKKGTAERWAKETPNIKKLPKRIKAKKGKGRKTSFKNKGKKIYG